MRRAAPTGLQRGCGASDVHIEVCSCASSHPLHGIGEYRRDHPWRKPNPGMILRAVSDLGLDAAQSAILGDKMSDIEAGAAAGIGLRILVTSCDAEEGEGAPSHEVVADLAEALALLRSRFLARGRRSARSRRQAGMRLPGRSRALINTRCGPPTAAAVTPRTSSARCLEPVLRWKCSNPVSTKTSTPTGRCDRIIRIDQPGRGWDQLYYCCKPSQSSAVWQFARPESGSTRSERQSTLASGAACARHRG
jgi:HAD-hyrolase-like